MHAPATLKTHGEVLAAITSDLRAAREMHKVSLEAFDNLDRNLVTQDIRSYHDLVIVRAHQDRYVDARAAVQVTMPTGCLIIPMPEPEPGTTSLTPAPSTGTRTGGTPPGPVSLTRGVGPEGDKKDCILCLLCLLVWCRSLAQSNDVVIRPESYHTIYI